MGNMTVGWCVGYCVGLDLIYAGLEGGTTCCECTPRRLLMDRLQFEALGPYSFFFDHTLRIADCGNELSQLAQNATQTDCDVPCAGDSTEMCGAVDPSPRLSLYCNLSATPPPPPSISQIDSTGTWNYLGCYKYAYVPYLFVWRQFVTPFCAFRKQRHRRGPSDGSIGVSDL